MRSDTTKSLEQLIQRIAEADVEALGILFDASGGKLLGLIRRIVGDPDAADETLLDVFAQVWRHAGQFDPQRGGAWSWLLTLTRTRALDRLRSRHRRLECMPIAPFGELLGRAVPDTTPSRVALEDEIRTALARLPAEQRRAIESAYLDGLSYSQAARRLEVPVGSIKSPIRVGLSTLRRSLAPAHRE